MNEKAIVNAVVDSLKIKGFKVSTEIANIYRSADICVLDNNGKVWVIECKVSNIGRAIQQTKVHKLSADKVFIATFYKKTRNETLRKIREAGVGLLYVMSDGTVSKPIEEPKQNKPWSLARDRLLQRIMDTK